jgi:hypothetical protein
MKKPLIFLLSLFFGLLLALPTFSQAYNRSAGINRVSDIKKARHREAVLKREITSQPSRSNNNIPVSAEEIENISYKELEKLDGDFNFESYDIEQEDTKVRKQQGHVIDRSSYEVEEDGFGNASGSEYDLARDGAFEGQTIVVLQLYTLESNFDFVDPGKALTQKGFRIKRYTHVPPTPKQLEKDLKDACQLWVISDKDQRLTEDHAKVIKNYWDKGHGLYIFGDNDPFYADANFLMNYLFDIGMNGNLPGGNTVTLRDEVQSTTPGVIPDHLISTGLEFCFEGITIATLDEHPDFKPLIYGSAGNLVTSVYEKDGKRCIIDGGFTRLYCNWNTAGSGRYVKNAAAWLTNYERFGDAVLGKN